MSYLEQIPQIMNVFYNTFRQFQYGKNIEGPNGMNNRNLGFVFKVEIDIQNFGYERGGNTHHPEWERCFYRALWFIVTLKHSVFLYKTDNPTLPLREIPHGEWVNTSNHDSCWRSDGVESVIYHETTEGIKACYDHMPGEHQQSERVRFQLNDDKADILRFVEIERIPMYSVENERKGLLRCVRPVTFSLKVDREYQDLDEWPHWLLKAQNGDRAFLREPGNIVEVVLQEDKIKLKCLSHCSEEEDDPVFFVVHRQTRKDTFDREELVRVIQNKEYTF